ncbi:MAG: hypothetical protein GF334_03830 [Candidatus Altiarchaeales archaeon]|nr:hypothetical protein [Candidatus Altiarchaeales archaeon]
MRNRTPPITRQPYRKPEIKVGSPPDGTQFRCFACNSDLFGIFRNGELEIKYRERVATMSGVLVIRCRKCGQESRIDTSRVAYRVNVVISDEYIMPEYTRAAGRLADKHGIDLREIPVTGKVTVKDVRGYLSENNGT